MGTGDTDWDPAAAYSAGAQVDHLGTLYTAKWWTQGFAPDTAVGNDWDSPWDPAVLIGDGPGGSGSEWQADKAYLAGQEVTRNGLTYKAKWWSQGFAPDTPVANDWETPWMLK